jgi:small subunit ribosomal protein S1
MTEGTRLGEFKEGTEQTFQSEVFKATKIGDLSEFEKGLIIEDAGTGSLKSDDFSLVMEDLVADYREGDIVKGIVRNIEKGGILVDIGYKSDAFIPNSEFSNDPDISPADVVKPGDEISGLIEKIESKEGYTLLSRKKAEYNDTWNALAALVKSREVIEVKVTSKVQGGLVAGFMGIKGFIPASQVLKEGEDNLGKFIDQTLEVIVQQADRKRRKVVFSRRFKARQSKEQIAQLLDSLEIGQVKQGKVSSIKDFGAFVDLGGIEGLIHISEISWIRVSHPSEKVSVGDQIDVFILGVDKETQRVSLGLKQLEQDPWVKVSEKYSIGQTIEGTVSRIVTFGAFVKIEDSLEGLIHISEISPKRISKVEDVLQVGQKVTARIIKLIPQEQRIGLSLKPLAEEASKPLASSEEFSSDSNDA